MNKLIFFTILVTFLSFPLTYANIVDELTKLNNLYKDGALNQEEFNNAKKILLKTGSNKSEKNQPKQTIKVKYSKTLPNLVEEKKGIIVEGKINKNNLFIAEIVLAKHDENYMPQSAIDKMRNDGIWRGN